MKLYTSELGGKLTELKAGERIFLSGTIYTARDAAHRRLVELMNIGKELPFTLNGSVIYYAGPTPAQQGMAVGSCGPTTAYRMDAFSPTLLDAGLAAMIAKGPRNTAVVEAIVRNGACYFAATGGAGALIAQCIKTAEVIAFEDLGTESIKRLTVENFPLIVAIDSKGNNLYSVKKSIK